MSGGHTETGRQGTFGRESKEEGKKMLEAPSEVEAPTVTTSRKARGAEEERSSRSVFMDVVRHRGGSGIGQR
eukprot:CAMPEP_0194313828 /NCGR_PEP_ID=MMETSP0171-20130528/10678_1 /TAXON_ID=218684 /ORGANISM="Corethron pennatum, Strain L29A3" /LENGTH=71 /DNA_ID=CAMNT_0039068951 /DNA_START=454 /DNA_END=666 /DNA_ORIENTATION=+